MNTDRDRMLQTHESRVAAIVDALTPREKVVLRSLAVADDPVSTIARATGLPRADVREALAAGRTEADLLLAFGRVRRSA